MVKPPRPLTRIWVILIALALGLLAASARAEDQQGASSRNMRLVGTNDLQACSTYQPTLHKYPQNRYILFAGHHALGLQGEGLLPNAQLLPPFNTLNRQE